jgi:hypothetical protein
MPPWGRTVSNPHDEDSLDVCDPEFSHASGVCFSDGELAGPIDDETPIAQSDHPISTAQIAQADSIQSCFSIEIRAGFLKSDICTSPAAGRTRSRSWKQ